ncbi:hypothetical protein COOONC_16684 [Cooperia oncophora]
MSAAVEEECAPSTSGGTGPKSKNAEKKARVFDFDSIFEETRKAGQARFIEAKAGTDEKATAERESLKDSGTVSEEDDDFLPMLPPGFVPDQSVIVNSSESQNKDTGDDDDEDFVDYVGDGIPIVNLIPTACEAKLVHGGKPVSDFS